MRGIRGTLNDKKIESYKEIEGKALQAEGTASARTLKWKKGCFFRSEKRPVGLGKCDIRRGQKGIQA